MIMQSTETRCSKAWWSFSALHGSSSLPISVVTHAFKLHSVLLLVFFYLLQHTLLLCFSFPSHFLKLVFVLVSVHSHILLESFELFSQLVLNVRHSSVVLLTLQIFKFVLLLPNLGLLFVNVVTLLWYMTTMWNWRALLWHRILLWTLLIMRSYISLFCWGWRCMQVSLAFSIFWSSCTDLRRKAHSLTRLSSCLSLLFFEYFPLFLDFVFNLLFVA